MMTNTNAMENEGRVIVNEFLNSIKGRLHKVHNVEEAINDADEAKVNVLGAFGDLINKYDALGIRKLSRMYRECIENATVDGRTSLFMLGKSLDICTDKMIAELEEDVQFCIKEGYDPKNALTMLAQVRCLKNDGKGHSVPGALVRSLLYIVQTTINKVSKWLGLQAEGTIWGALGKALKCFGGILKVGLRITRTVIKGIACYAVAGATKLGQLFMRAFYVCVGTISTWKSNRNHDIEDDFDDYDEEAVSAAADELYAQFVEDGSFEPFEA